MVAVRLRLRLPGSDGDWFAKEVKVIDGQHGFIDGKHGFIRARFTGYTPRRPVPSAAQVVPISMVVGNLTAALAGWAVPRLTPATLMRSE